MRWVGDWSQLVGQASSLLHHSPFLALTPMANVCSQYTYPDLTRLATYIPVTKSVTPQKAVPAEWLHACMSPIYKAEKALSSYSGKLRLAEKVGSDEGQNVNPEGVRRLGFWLSYLSLSRP